MPTAQSVIYRPVLHSSVQSSTLHTAYSAYMYSINPNPPFPNKPFSPNRHAPGRQPSHVLILQESIYRHVRMYCTVSTSISTKPCSKSHGPGPAPAPTFSGMGNLFSCDLQYSIYRAVPYNVKKCKQGKIPSIPSLPTSPSTPHPIRPISTSQIPPPHPTIPQDAARYGYRRSAFLPPFHVSNQLAGSRKQQASQRHVDTVLLYGPPHNGGRVVQYG
jgi:hypothetical protein